MRTVMHGAAPAVNIFLYLFFGTAKFPYVPTELPRITINLPPELADKLREAAKADNRTMANLVTKIVRDHFESIRSQSAKDFADGLKGLLSQKSEMTTPSVHKEAPILHKQKRQK
jgi:hypothetical protein